MKTASTIATIAAICFLASASASDRYSDVELSFGLGSSNVECGTGVGRAYVRFDDDHPVRPAHLIVESGPNGSCSGQGTAVDAEAAWVGIFAEQSPWTWRVSGAYDQRVVPFEYATRDPGKLYRGVEVVTVSVLFGVCRSVPLGTACLRFDAIEQDYERGGGTSPFGASYSGVYRGFEFDAALTALGDSDPIFDVSMTRVIGGFEFGASASYNAALLDNPAPDFLVADDGTRLARLGGPRIVYSLRVGRRL